MITTYHRVTPGLCAYRLVAVGADWTGSENVLGYPSGLDPKSYIATPALEVILSAAVHADVPHFLIFDEMNLSHVERYFADVLSAIESDESLPLYTGNGAAPDTWREAGPSRPVPPSVGSWPRNLFTIGTVNVDETTYMFSPKVLDRASVLEFRAEASEIEAFLDRPVAPRLADLDGAGAAFGASFVETAAALAEVPQDVKKEFDSEILLFFLTLQAHGLEFGYRTAYESARFIHLYRLFGNRQGSDEWLPAAIDYVIAQKLLPKLHGSRTKLGPVLKKLWFLCVHGHEARGAAPLEAAQQAATSSDAQREPSIVVPADALYPVSASKIGRMWRLLAENGFTSFAEA